MADKSLCRHTHIFVKSSLIKMEKKKRIKHCKEYNLFF